jgi:hypothetical protein
LRKNSPFFVILSEAKNLSSIQQLENKEREILRSAQNDRTKLFFPQLFSLSGLDLCGTRTLILWINGRKSPYGRSMSRPFPADFQSW